MTSDFYLTLLYRSNMPFILSVRRTLRNPLKRIILALVAGLVVTLLILFVDTDKWSQKFEKGAREHRSDFLTVNHWEEVKNEALDIISYLLGVWTKYWSS